MKRIILPALILFVSCTGFAQQMQIRKFNFQSFSKEEAQQPALLKERSSAEARQHPEFGILPYNAQCKGCMELIDKRTANTRLLIDMNDGSHVYSQSSYFPLHYKKSAQDIWRTIDPRLCAVPGQQGVFEASHQPVATGCNLVKKSTTINAGGLEFEFNKDLTLYFFDGENAFTQRDKGNYSQYTVGEDGLLIKEMWPGLEMQQVFTQGQIETDYVLYSPLQLPVSKGWMVIEDHFTLPAGYTFGQEVAVSDGKKVSGFYSGNYVVRNSAGEVLITYGKPVYLDANSIGRSGQYKLLQVGNNYTLQMYVPVEWLNDAGNAYPLIIDPKVTGSTLIGNFESSGQPLGSMGFTSLELGSCDYNMEVLVPGNSDLTNVYVDLEYELTRSRICGNPALSSPYCTFDMVHQEVVSDACQTTTGPITCFATNSQQDSTYTTDPSAATGAHAFLVNGTTPNYLSCIPKQCSNYRLKFILKNSDSLCLDRCGYECAIGNAWRMTVEGYTDTIPPVAAITRAGNKLTSSYVNGNQWFRNDTAIAGATGNEYIVARPGIYKVIVSGVDCPSNSINITCAAYFSILPDNTTPGHYYGYNLSIGNNAVYHWDFGDNDTSNLAFPAHQYAQAGRYNVCLQVRSGNCTNTYCDSSFYVFKTEGGLMSHLNIVGGPTEITEPGEEGSMQIYPNPATNRLMISVGSSFPQSLAVYNVQGQKLMEQKFVSQLDISALVPGMYFIEVKGAKVTARRQFIKE